MNRLLDNRLCKAYPEIFEDRYGDMRETSMVWGFECQDGWYDLIDTLCADIMRVCGKRIPYATQVKEKYGGLCFYISGANEKVGDLITKAEAKSRYICEYCGKKGKIREKRGWYKTLCKKDAETLEYE